jgi:hypothetical protein
MTIMWLLLLCALAACLAEVGSLRSECRPKIGGVCAVRALAGSRIEPCNNRSVAKMGQSQRLQLAVILARRGWDDDDYSDPDQVVPQRKIRRLS